MAKTTKYFGSTEDINLDFCWFFGSSVFMGESHLCLVYQFLFNRPFVLSVVQLYCQICHEIPCMIISELSTSLDLYIIYILLYL
jgi:hypothetical protein